MTNVGANLVAINAKTGKRYADFGDNGQVDLTKGFERTITGWRWSSGPLVVKDVVVVAGVPSPATDILNERARAPKEMPPDDVRGYDVRTGKLLWTFHVVPRKGEPGNDTWLNDSWTYSGNSGAWSLLSADEDLGYVYLPFEEATATTTVARGQVTTCMRSRSSASTRAPANVYGTSRPFIMVCGITTFPPLQSSATSRSTDDESRPSRRCQNRRLFTYSIA